MLPSGPERQTLFDKSAQLMTAYAPYRLAVHRIITDMSYKSVVGYRRPPFSVDWWQYVDIDTSDETALMWRTAIAAAPLLLGANWAAAAASAPEASAGGGKVLRYAFIAAETGFDPAKISDLYSRICTAHMFEALYRFDYLARLPSKVVPHAAAAMPEISDDFRTWTIRIRPGVYFADDPAFKGKPRELVAADFAYAWKRHFDPVNKDPNYTGFKEEGVLGVDELREAAIRDKKPFNCC